MVHTQTAECRWGWAQLAVCCFCCWKLDLGLALVVTLTAISGPLQPPACYGPIIQHAYVDVSCAPWARTATVAPAHRRGRRRADLAGAQRSVVLADPRWRSGTSSAAPRSAALQKRYERYARWPMVRFLCNRHPARQDCRSFCARRHSYMYVYTAASNLLAQRRLLHAGASEPVSTMILAASKLLKHD